MKIQICLFLSVALFSACMTSAGARKVHIIDFAGETLTYEHLSDIPIGTEIEATVKGQAYREKGRLVSLSKELIAIQTNTAEVSLSISTLTRIRVRQGYSPQGARVSKVDTIVLVTAGLAVVALYIAGKIMADLYGNYDN